MAARRNTAPALGDVLLITGTEAFLADRAVRSAITAVTKTAPELEVTDVQAADLDAGALAELTGPSLLAAERMLVLRGLENLAAEVAPRLADYAAQPAPDVTVVLVHSGGAKGKAVLDRLRKAGVNEIVAAAPKAWELPQFVAGEIRALGGSADERAASALVDAVGHDLRALAGACSQLVADAGGQPVTPELVGRYFGGRAEVTSFAVADAAIAGRAEPALEQLRWALDAGVAPVLVTSA
ncbi:MAG TPA: DNA polymerase III subunit delta, partial [Kribbellaceae bacterium]